MKKSTRGMSLVIAIALLMPILVIGIQNTAEQPSIWIVYTESPDESMMLAAQTFKNEMISVGCEVGETTLSLMDNIPKYSDAIALVGHGHLDGIEVEGKYIHWEQVTSMLTDLHPQTIILLACNSPSNKDAKIFGFTGQIDAEAGGLLSAWKLSQILISGTEDRILLEQAAEAQMKMAHPLESYVYFVHGYFGSSDDFGDMQTYLDDNLVTARYDGFREFSYWEPYWELFGDDFDTWDDFMWEMHSGFTLTDFAEDFAYKLIDEHEGEHGVQIDIVAHSLGGLISREMLRNWRVSLAFYGIEFGRVITLGTPHQGTELASGDIVADVFFYIQQFTGSPNWQSPLFSTFIPSSPLITTLNADPLSYSANIEWYTVAGIDIPRGYLAAYIHGDLNNDLLVAKSRAHLSFAVQVNFQYVLLDPIAHVLLVKDTQHRTDGLLDSWLLGGIDTDNDGLLDIKESYLYSTNPTDSDSDDDGISDGDEVNIYNTNPTVWSTDGDILSDGQEIAWGYNPLSATDPISAPALVYSAWQVNGVTGYVRANHYTAMDYVKVYVKYKNSYGQWTGNMLVGTDSTPYYSGDYYLSWSLLSGYVQMLVTVQAFDSANHYLGCDTQYVTLPYDGGGGGKPGGDPVPE